MEEPNNSSEDTNVRVAVRCRPFNGKEKANGESSCVIISKDQVILKNPAGHHEEHSFAFDLVIDENFSQEKVWVNVGVPILNKAFSGFNGTIFAYGQTGSGKTWSMQGGDAELQGIIPRMNKQLFSRISEEIGKRPTVQFLVTVSYFEIYNEVIFDLLDSTDRKKRNAANKGGLEIKEHPALGVYVKGLQEIVVDSDNKLQSIIDSGMKNRTVASTQMNADSSRSHSVFIINLHQKDVEDETKNIFAKVNLVDLAGSERVKSTGATGSILKEGANINKSLSALGNVINALVEVSKGKGAFIPYRNSKLTRVLQESLGGNSITAMLAALSPAASNFEETLSTLKYANRAKAIKVKAVKNEQSSTISRLNDEIKALKEKLMSQGTGGAGGAAAGAGGGAGGGLGGDGSDGSALEDKNRQRLKDLEEAMKSTWEAKSKMSEEYERDRQALLIEQQNAARQMEVARQRNWTLLQQRGDVDVTLGHVRTLLTDKVSSTHAAEVVSALVQQWAEALRGVASIEQALAEQDTIVQVYRSTLEKDSNALLQLTIPDCATAAGEGKNRDSSSTTSLLDTNAFSMLRQLREKFATTNIEMQKWTSLQDELLATLLTVTALMKEAGSIRSIVNNAGGVPETTQSGSSSSSSSTSSTSSQQLSKDERRELAKGLSMIRRQVTQKYSKSQSAIVLARKEFLNFASVRGDIEKLLGHFDNSIADVANMAAGDTTAAAQEEKEDVEEEDSAIAKLIADQSTGSTAMQNKLQSMLKAVNEMFSSLEEELIAAEAAADELSDLPTPNPGSPSSHRRSASRLLHDRGASGGGGGGGRGSIPFTEEVGIDSVQIEHFDPRKITNPRSSMNRSSRVPVAASSSSSSSSSSHAAGGVGGGGSASGHYSAVAAATLVAVDGPSSWTGLPHVEDEEGGGVRSSEGADASGTNVLTLSLATPQRISSIILQGGFVVDPASEKEEGGGSALSSSSAAAPVQSATVPISDVMLPCGVSLSTCEPRIEITAAALADVIDWTALLKSNAPEKLLKRPPVRFIFDLMKFIGDNNEGFYPESLSIQLDWAIVGVDKTSKMNFMNQIIQFITKRVFASEPKTSATAIVTGSDTELTNLLLQQLAVALYCHRNQIPVMAASPSLTQLGSSTGTIHDGHPQSASLLSKVANGAVAADGPAGAQVVNSWVTELRVEWSEDGETWTPCARGDMQTGLRAAKQAVTLPLIDPAHGQDAAQAVFAKYLRLIPLHWEHDKKEETSSQTTKKSQTKPVDDSNVASLFGPAMRVLLQCPELLSDDEDELPLAPAAAEGHDEMASTVPTAAAAAVVVVKTARVASATKLLVEALGVLIEAVEFRSRNEELRKELKQLEVKKHLENLAKEKQALETLLANEKQSLESDNQDLSDQLKKCFQQLKETQGLFEKEQEINAQLDRSRQQLEEEKVLLQKALQEKEEENSKSKAEVLNLQAIFEKDRHLAEEVKGKLLERDGMVETLKEQLKHMEEERAQAENEKEDLQSQIQILIEERDAARAEEEDLFEKLGERTNDLDRLQESYVDIADRCNDAQDEVMDLQDKIESLQNALASKTLLQSTLASGAANGNLHNNGNNSVLNGTVPQREEEAAVSMDAMPKSPLVIKTAEAPASATSSPAAASSGAKSQQLQAKRQAKATAKATMRSPRSIEDDNNHSSSSGGGGGGSSLISADEKHAIPAGTTTATATTATAATSSSSSRPSSNPNPPPAPSPARPSPRPSAGATTTTTTGGGGDYNDDFDDYEEEFEED